MKNLFFVSVALGILSGTSISVKAQHSVNDLRFIDGVAEKKLPAFIEGIEIQPGIGMSARAPIKPKIRGISGKVTKAALDFSSVIETCTSLQFKYAQIMNMDVEAVINLPLYNFLEDWWGTRYRYGGMGRNGIDCSAYSGALLNEVFKIKTPRTARAMYGVSEKISRKNLKEGDLVFFNTRGGVSHVGVYLGNGFFTHASSGNGVTINNLNENYYNRRFIIGGRLNAEPVTIE